MHDPDLPNSLNHNSVYDILEGSVGSLWLGTNGGGLDHLY
ncbi:MAG TPA: hypothetical protein DDY13_02035 [Cytophagales bacterium]|jgi:hypothetical protein|nr:hypothetical protein [Cytophagales bacterium]